MNHKLPILLLAFAALPLAHAAQSDDEQLSAIILAKDKQFWTDYNQCSIDSFKAFFTPDVEFYHDKGGITLGVDNLLDTMKRNLCGAGGDRLRREAVPDTAKVFPLRNGNQVYGAILSGEHVFYVRSPGKAEFLDGRANFTHLWLKKDGDFKIARVLSFNHHPAVPRQGK